MTESGTSSKTNPHGSPGRGLRVAAVDRSFDNTTTIALDTDGRVGRLGNRVRRVVTG
jgi:hypothetical protein